MQERTLGAGIIPPQKLDMECALIGSILNIGVHAYLKITHIITEEVFYKDQHQQIFKAIADLAAKSKAIDTLTVCDQLTKNGHLQTVGGAYYINELSNIATQSYDISYHSKAIYEAYLKRQLIKESMETISSAYNDTTDIFELIEKHQSNTFKLVSMYHGRDMVQIDQCINEVMEDLDKPVIDGLSGIATGSASLDLATGGWMKSDLVIIAARPAMGKTALLLQLAKSAAINQQQTIIFSLEMSRMQLTKRLIASHTDIHLTKLVKRNMNEFDRSQMDNTLTSLYGAALHIDDSPTLTVNDLRAKSIRHKEKNGLDLVVIDYLQLMDGTNSKKGNNREQEISYISRSLKALAKDLDCPVIALSQLSRAVESRPGSKRPMLSDLRESGSIEQDSDMVCFLYRPEYYGISEDEEGNSTAGICEVIIAKFRNGATDTVQLKFNGSVMKFTDLEEEFKPAFPGIVIHPSRLNEEEEEF